MDIFRLNYLIKLYNVQVHFLDIEMSKLIQNKQWLFYIENDKTMNGFQNIYRCETIDVCVYLFGLLGNRDILILTFILYYPKIERNQSEL